MYNRGSLIKLAMVDEDDRNNVRRMPMDDRGHVAVMDYSDEEDDIRWGENDDMDDLGEDESDEEESDDDDDEEDENDEGIESEEEEEESNDDEVETFIRSFHTGDYDQEFDDTLSSNRSVTWLVPARPTQASYNKPNNWKHINQQGLAKLKRQLQNCIRLAYLEESFNLDLTHNSYQDQLMDNEEPIVWHEPILDEYWHRIEEAIDRKKHATDISGIHIQNVEMKKFRLAMIVDIWRRGGATNSSTYIDFINTNLCADGIISLSELVDVSSELQVLRLCHNRIDNMESARCFSRSLKTHTRIDHVRLTHCELGRSPEVLLVILQSDIKYIDLENNNIDSLGAVKIAEYLEGDPPIHRIDLEHNRLNDDDALLISQALQTNMNLETLYIQSNNFTSIGVKAFLTCVFDSSSLNSISESNHTLGELNMFWRGNNETSDRLQGCIDRCLDLNRMQKILLALQDKDSLLKYLANVPVVLIPDVLAFPLQRIDDEHQHQHLNLVYSTMRWWNMPLLYSYYDCVKSDTKRKRDD